MYVVAVGSVSCSTWNNKNEVGRTPGDTAMRSSAQHQGVTATCWIRILLFRTFRFATSRPNVTMAQKITRSDTEFGVGETATGKERSRRASWLSTSVGTISDEIRIALLRGLVAKG